MPVQNRREVQLPQRQLWLQLGNLFHMASFNAAVNL
jgi:hypothetical protein